MKCDKRSINGKLLGIYRGKNIGIKTKETDHMEWMCIYKHQVELLKRRMSCIRTTVLVMNINSAFGLWIEKRVVKNLKTLPYERTEYQYMH